MAGDVMSLQIISPEQTVLKDIATEAIIVPSTEGSLGILVNHAPMVSTLRAGVLRYKQNGKFVRVAVSGGFVEFSANRATVLADTAEPGESVDVMRAREARKRAEKRLAEKAANLDRTRAEAALQRAIARLKAAGAMGDEKQF